MRVVAIIDIKDPSKLVMMNEKNLERKDEDLNYSEVEDAMEQQLKKHQEMGYEVVAVMDIEWEPILKDFM